MISAFGIEHTVSKAYTKAQPRLLKMMRHTSPKETMRERVETNYIQNRLAGGLHGRMHGKKATSAANKSQLDNAKLARQQTKAWETAANNMNRRESGTGIGRMEAHASRRLAGGPSEAKRPAPGLKTPLPHPPWEKKRKP